MATRLFVGGLSYATDTAALKEAFAVHGEVIDAVVITDRETGRSKGFGFVTFAEPASAEAAIQAMDGARLDGRRIAVNVARERTPRGGRGSAGGPRSGFGRRPPPAQPDVIQRRGRGPRAPREQGSHPSPPGWFVPPEPGDGAWGEDRDDRRRRSRRFDRERERRRNEEDDWSRRRSGGRRGRRRDWYDDDYDE